MNTERVLLRPIILTEKSARLREQSNKVVFEVNLKANKIQIRNAVEKHFSVKVKDVNTLIMRGKLARMGRGHEKRPNWKKAVITLNEGDSIQFFDEEKGA